jgi:hypothetical protein
VNIGLALVLLLSSLDSSIVLTNDKINLLNKNWDPTISKYLSNGGKVIQKMRGIKDLIDFCKVPLAHQKEISILVESPQL